MKSFNLKKVAAVSALSLVALVGSSVDANAQGRGNNQRNQERKIEKAEKKIEKQQAKIARKQLRIYRNGRYYNTDQRGADLLRQAVNAGYQQGLQAGRNDRSSRCTWCFTKPDHPIFCLDFDDCRRKSVQ